MTNTSKGKGKSRWTGRTKMRTSMTAEEATQFDAMSSKSALQVAEAIDVRREIAHPNCECSPYDDVFTMGRWNAQGKVVKKGEKSLRISSFIPIPPSKKVLEEKPDAQPYMKPYVLYLFCRCQVRTADKE